MVIQIFIFSLLVSFGMIAIKTIEIYYQKEFFVTKFLKRADNFVISKKEYFEISLSTLYKDLRKFFKIYLPEKTLSLLEILLFHLGKFWLNMSEKIRGAKKLIRRTNLKKLDNKDQN